jgi:hypothetical protein
MMLVIGVCTLEYDETKSPVLSDRAFSAIFFRRKADLLAA